MQLILHIVRTVPILQWVVKISSKIPRSGSWSRSASKLVVLLLVRHPSCPKKDYKNSSTSSSVISEMISTIVPVPQWKNFLSKIPELTKWIGSPSKSNRLQLQSHTYPTSRKVSSKFVDKLLSYPADRQTDKGKNITSVAKVRAITN